ncbi:hypothetical protein D3C76_1335740 [compost metagenome]
MELLALTLPSHLLPYSVGLSISPATWGAVAAGGLSVVLTESPLKATLMDVADTATAVMIIANANIFFIFYLINIIQEI